MSRLAVATARRVARAKHSRRQPVMKKPHSAARPPTGHTRSDSLPKKRRRRRRQRARRQRHPHPSMPRGGTRLPRLHWRRRPTGGESATSAPATTRWSPVCTRLPPATHKPRGFRRLACGAGLYPARLQVRSLPQRTRSRREHRQEVKQSALGALGVLLGAIPPRRHPRCCCTSAAGLALAHRTSDHRLRPPRRGCIRATELICPELSGQRIMG